MEKIKDPINVQVARWVEKAKSQASAALQATATDALARVKELTPVDTGNLRANWQITMGGDLLPIQDRASSSPELMASLNEKILGETIVLSNPVIYAMRIEFGFTGTDSRGYHYNQKGHFMLTQTIAEMPQIADAATNRVIGGACEL